MDVSVIIRCSLHNSLRSGVKVVSAGILWIFSSSLSLLSVFLSLSLFRHLSLCISVYVSPYSLLPLSISVFPASSSTHLSWILLHPRPNDLQKNLDSIRTAQIHRLNPQGRSTGGETFDRGSELNCHSSYG